MQGISTKVGAGGLVGAVVGVLVWVLTSSTVGIELEIPPEIAVYASTIIGFVLSWFVPEKAVIDIDR